MPPPVRTCHQTVLHVGVRAGSAAAGACGWAWGYAAPCARPCPSRTTLTHVNFTRTRTHHTRARTHLTAGLTAGDSSTDANALKQLTLPPQASEEGILSFIEHCSSNLGLNYTRSSSNKLTMQGSVPDIGSKATSILEAAKLHISSSITSASFTGTSLRSASIIVSTHNPTHKIQDTRYNPTPRGTPHATPSQVRTCLRRGSSVGVRAGGVAADACGWARGCTRLARALAPPAHTPLSRNSRTRTHNTTPSLFSYMF